jgi:penicillin amidase
MVTSAAPSQHRTRRFVFWIVLTALALGLAAVLGATAWFYAAARAALPQVNGVKVQPGLQAPVALVRDGQGVPHITAAQLDDLFFAQGYVTAQDRLWQMDMLRRYAAGELAEVLGADYVEHDQRQRTLLMRRVAANAAAHLSPRDRAVFEAYARGVNACIAGQKPLPIEFRILGYRPRPWTVTDSFLVAGNMVQSLNLDALSHRLSRQKISARLAPELAADLYPNSSWRDRPPEPSFQQSAISDQQLTTLNNIGSAGEKQIPRYRLSNQDRGPEAPTTAGLLPQQAKTRLAGDPGLEASATERVGLNPGSNNWVLSGAHTVSGKPLLANDMHLGHQLPNVWYEAHLTNGNFDVAGVTLPGVPLVVVGHNRRIAWGCTNIGPTVADFFVESFNPAGQYLTPAGWQEPERRQETIHIRGRRDQSLEVVITRHGPIVSSLFPGETRQLALKWTGYEPDGFEVPLFDMDAAQNWAQFSQALQHFSSPAQNVVYADMDGHIGYHATGRIPIRAAGDGSLPVSGTDNAHEWTGYIPFEQLPASFDPPSGIIATANGRITPDGYPFAISDEWGPPYRTERIYHVLEGGRRFSPADMLALQTDVYSEFDRFCAQRFAYSVDHASGASTRARQAADLMRAWDGNVTVDSAAATLAVASRQELTGLLLEPKLGDLWPGYEWFMAPVWLENLLLHEPARWLPAAYPGWDELLAAAVNAAVSRADIPSNLNEARWGRDHYVDIEHPLFGRIPLLRRWTDTGRMPQSGDGYTVKQVGRRFGPSERLTVDLSDLDASTLNIVNGQSGEIFSPHYMDQWRAWYEGKTFAFPFSAAAVDKAKAQVLVLEP